MSSPSPVPDPPDSVNLLSIGAFARRCGLTASALRFYDDAGLLTPATVDPHTGYRRYHPDQLRHAVRLRRLREIDMPLAEVEAALANDEAMARIVDAHLTRLGEQAARARANGQALLAEVQGSHAESLTPAGDVLIDRLRGPQLAAAFDQVLSATAADPAQPVLGGIHVEIAGDTLTLTATDRFRLARRTLPLNTMPRTADADWQATLHGTDVRALLSALRGHAVVRMTTTSAGYLAIDTRPTSHTRGEPIGVVRMLPERFPDHAAMVDALPPVAVRLTLPRRETLAALEHTEDDHVLVMFTHNVVHLAGTPVDAKVSIENLGHVENSAPSTIWFAVTTLYPALVSAVGSDVLLDLRGPGQPATVRSADNGDLLTLVMPVAAPA